MQTTCFLEKMWREALTFRITFMYSFVIHLANMYCMLTITRNCVGSWELKEKQDTISDFQKLTF